MEERRRVEEELKRSEERYRSIIETDPECVLILAPDGKLLEMNPAGLAMIEADSFEQVAGRPVYPLIAPEHRDAFRELVERVFSGDTGVLEFEMIGLKGTLRWLEIHAVPLRDGGERITGLLAVTRDITDRKRTEKELSQEKAFNDAVINSLPGIFYVYEEGQRLIKWNKTLETRTGYSPDELLNKHALDWFAEEERERIATEIKNVMDRGEATVEANLVLKDGARVPYVLTGTRLRSEGRNYLIGIGIEITELRQVEEELRKAEQEWRDTFDSISDFVSVHDREFRIVKANRALVDFLGISRDELIGRRCYEVFHGTNQPLSSCPYIESMRLKKTVTAEVEYTKLGIPLLVTSSPLFNGDGDLIGGVHFARDVSGIKAAEEQIRRKSEELSVLNQITRRSQEFLRIDEFIETALEAVSSFLAPDIAMFYLFENDKLHLKGHRPEEEVGVVEEKELGVCLCGIAAKEKEPVYSTDIHRDVRCTLGECKRAGISSFAAISLRRGDELLGLIGLAWKEKRSFGEGEKGFFETLGAGLSLALHNSKLYEEVRKHARVLEIKVEERTEELQKIVNLMAGREVRMEELKEVIRQLREQIETAGFTPVANDPLREG